MANRRRNQRYALLQPLAGTLGVARPVLISRNAFDELLAVSSFPFPPGEVMTLGAVGAGPSIIHKVRVSESRPVIVEGVLRHCLTLTVLDA